MGLGQPWSLCPRCPAPRRFVLVWDEPKQLLEQSRCTAGALGCRKDPTGAPCKLLAPASDQQEAPPVLDRGGAAATAGRARGTPAPQATATRTGRGRGLTGHGRGLSVETPPPGSGVGRMRSAPGATCQRRRRDGGAHPARQPAAGRLRGAGPELPAGPAADRRGGRAERRQELRAGELRVQVRRRARDPPPRGPPPRPHLTAARACRSQRSFPPFPTVVPPFPTVAARAPLQRRSPAPGGDVRGAGGSRLRAGRGSSVRVPVPRRRRGGPWHGSDLGVRAAGKAPRLRCQRVRVPGGGVELMSRGKTRRLKLQILIAVGVLGLLIVLIPLRTLRAVLMCIWVLASF